MRRLGLLFLLALPVAAQDFDRKSDVVYGRKHGVALTMDVFTPKARARKTGVIFVVSGGWFSSTRQIRPGFYLELLKKGHTVFAVVHGSQPKYNIAEIVPDLQRSVRFIRHNAKRFGIEPDRIGIMGASAGGHLSLMIGTAPPKKNPVARDAVDRESSRVQAVAAFFPPTDFLNWGKTGTSIADLDTGRRFRAAFDFRRFDRKTRTYERITERSELEKELRAVSPLHHVSADDAPVLLFHGDRDALVPIQQSRVMSDALKKAGVETRLEVRPGQAHGWQMGPDIALCADWFTRKLVKKAPIVAR